MCLIEVRNVLGEWMEKEGVSARAFSLSHTIRLNTFLDVLNGRRKAHLRTLKRISRATKGSVSVESMQRYLAHCLKLKRALKKELANNPTNSSLMEGQLKD